MVIEGMALRNGSSGVLVLGNDTHDGFGSSSGLQNERIDIGATFSPSFR